MQYGVFIPNFKCYGEARAVAELAHEAEDAGWDGLFIWDHVNRREAMGDVVDPWIALTAAAMVTQRIRLGTMVTPVPRRRPWNLARETVSLDRLSDGRVVLGVGIGSGREMEWNDLGEETDPRVRGAMLDEGLAILDGLWSAERFAYDGAYYQVDNVKFMPGPVQQPRIPVWVGGNWPNKPPMRRAARWDGVFSIFKSQVDAENLGAFREMVAFIGDQRESAAPFEFVYRGAPNIEADVLAEFRDAGLTWWLSDIAPHRFGGEWEVAWPCEAMRDAIRQGPPRLD